MTKILIYVDLGSRVSFDNFVVLGPGGTILLCIFNSFFYKWPLYEALIYNCSVIKKLRIKKVTYIIFLQFTNSTKQSKRPFEEISKIFKGPSIYCQGLPDHEIL